MNNWVKPQLVALVSKST